jgi:hypothetical protein
MERDTIELIAYAAMIGMWLLFVASLIALIIVAALWLWRHLACSLLVATIALMINHFSAE